jgi:hypothetical protein
MDAPAAQSSSIGRLKMSITPPDATVYLDDRFLGSGEDLSGSRIGTPVEPGKRTLTVVRPGFKTKTLDLDIRLDKSTEVSITLER